MTPKELAIYSLEQALKLARAAGRQYRGMSVYRLSLRHENTSMSRADFLLHCERTAKEIEAAIAWVERAAHD